MTAFMHINGFPGSGKTTLGNKLKEKFKHLIIVKDLDDFLPINKSTIESKKIVENKIQKFINRNDDKIIILIGTVCNNANDEEYPIIDAKYLIWYDVPLNVATERALNRQIDWLHNNRKEFIKMTIRMTSDQCDEYLSCYYNYHQRITDWEPLHDICKTNGYIEMNDEKIIDLITKKIIIQRKST